MNEWGDFCIRYSMDTILYFYVMKEYFPKPWFIQRYPYEAYLLVRIGIAPTTLEVLRQEPEDAKKEQIQQREELLRVLAETLFYLVRTGSRCEAYFEEKVKCLEKMWEYTFPFPCLRMEELSRDPWVEILFSCALEQQDFPRDYLLINCEESVYPVLWKRAREIRSLSLIPGRTVAEASLAPFLQELELQYGILTNITQRVLPGMAVTVLDFSGEQSHKNVRVAAGSVWLDFHPLPEKRRYVEERMREVSYVSMLRFWKTPQK